MFTGIVKELGRIAQPAPRLAIEAPDTAPGVVIGDSVAVSGVCLTVVEIDGPRLGALTDACPLAKPFFTLVEELGIASTAALSPVAAQKAAAGAKTVRVVN